MDPLTYYREEWSQQGDTEIRVQTEEREFSWEAVKTEKWWLKFTDHSCSEKTVHDREDSILLQVKLKTNGMLFDQKVNRKVSGKTQTSDTWLAVFNRTMY